MILTRIEIEPRTAGLATLVIHPAILSVGAFLAVWGTTSNFSLDYRAILGAVVAGVFGYASPKK